MRHALTATLAILAAAIAVPPAGAEAPPFDWTMPDRLGQDVDGDGLIDYPQNAASVSGGPFTVVFEVRPDLCHPRSIYSWTIEGRLAGGGNDECRFAQRFAAEGVYDVELRIDSPDGDSATYGRNVDVQDWLVVSIGDSVASGEGNPDRRGLVRRATWQSPRCHRSTLAAPVGAALALEASDPRTSTTFVHLACSGAALRHGLLEPYEGIDVPARPDPRVLPPQVAELEAIASQRQIDAVLVNIGANDIHFGAVVAFCIRFGECVGRNFDPAKPGHGDLGYGQAERLPDVIAGSLKRLKAGYEELGTRLARIVDPNRVLIVDYFDPTHDREGETCKKIGVPFLPHFYIDHDEAAWAYDSILTPLNREIADSAAREGWTEVTGVAEAFRNHGYCAGGESWVRSLARSLFSQAGDNASSRLTGALHPNEEGHRQTAALIGAVLQRTLYAADENSDDAAPTDDAGIVAPPEDEGEVHNESEGEGDSEEATEHAAAIGLLGTFGVLGLALAAVGGTRLARRRSKPAPQGWPIAPGTLPEPIPPVGSARGFRELLESSGEWVHRRVESIEFIDERTIRRRVSVDFTPTVGAASPPPTHAPIALLHKCVLTRFDLRDEAGGSLPLLTATQNAAFATQHMLEVAERASSMLAPPRLRELCWTIARAEPPEAERAIAEIANHLEPQALRESLRKSPLFRSVTTTFAHSFPVIVAIDETANRRVVKFAYDEVVGGGPKFLARLGLRSATLLIRLPELGDAGSRHIEFLRANGLETFDARLVARTPNRKPLLRRVSAGGGREAHLSVTGAPRGTSGVAGVRLRGRRQGILVGGPLLAALAAASLTAAWFALPQLAEDSSGAASVLLAVPAALGAYLGARDPHPLVAAMLTGARGLVFASGVISFVAAGALALDVPVDALRPILGIAALASWLTAAGLATIWLLPRAPKPEDRPRTP